jgi:AcrR family transcriptional regulator
VSHGQRPPGTRITNAQRVLRAAADLLDAGGVAAVSTRAVAAAAGVQPPVIYRQFGDKAGLLDAVAHYALLEYLRTKQHVLVASDDPLDKLRRAWDLHVEFGLNHPSSFLIAFGTARRPSETGSAAKETVELLHRLLTRLAEQGKLRMSVGRATNIMYAAGVGTVLTLMRIPSSRGDAQFSTIARENALSAILSHPLTHTESGLPACAVALAEAVRSAQPAALSPSEQAVLVEWLSRLANEAT